MDAIDKKRTSTVMLCRHGSVAVCVCVLLLLTVASASAQHTDVRELRSLYYKSYREKAQAEKLYKLTASVSSSDPLLYGYKAIASIMMCNHLYNPYTKLKYFYNGRNDLELAIKGKSGDPELRYLRFAVQCHSPLVLNYSGNIKEDKRALLNYLYTTENMKADADLYRRISEYMHASKEVNDDERRRISAAMQVAAPFCNKG